MPIAIVPPDPAKAELTSRTEPPKVVISPILSPAASDAPNVESSTVTFPLKFPTANN